MKSTIIERKVFVFGRHVLSKYLHMRSLRKRATSPKNMAAKKNTLRFCSRSYVSVCKYSVVGRKQQLADLTVSKRPGTINRIEIHFAVFNHLNLCFSFMKLAETL